eukprot:466316-Pelagomonas_calceolata.AAC.1
MEIIHGNLPVHAGGQRCLEHLRKAVLPCCDFWSVLDCAGRYCALPGAPARADAERPLERLRGAAEVQLKE